MSGIYTQTLRTELGVVGVEASSSGLVRVVFRAVDGEPNAVTEMAAAQLEEYLAGMRREFTVPLDRRVETFREQVQAALSAIPFGETVSYSELAARVGNPKAVRAAGTACATNPLPIIVPCHRVLRSDGSLGGYAGGLAWKKHLLRLEGHELH